MPEPQTIVVKVGMHCEGCRRKVKKALSKLPGVEELKVDLKEQRVTIRGDVDVKKVMSKIARTGKVNEIVQQTTTATADANKPKETTTTTTSTTTTTTTPTLTPTTTPTKEAIMKDIQLASAVWVDTAEFLSDDNPNACSIM